MIKVENKQQVYEIDGKDVTGPRDEYQLTVASHWNRPEFVVIKFGDNSYTVVANDIIAAIQNAKNTNRY